MGTSIEVQRASNISYYLVLTLKLRNPVKSRVSRLRYFFSPIILVGELIGLRWQDVDFNKREIDINHALFYFAGKKNKKPCRWVVSDAKTEAQKKKRLHQSIY